MPWRASWPTESSSSARIGSNGLENAPAGLIGLLEGANVGKRYVQL
jgi:NADPH-dependent curcumin reductase CurA